MHPKPSKKPVSNERIGEAIRWMVEQRQKSYAEDNPVTGIMVSEGWVRVAQTMSGGVAFQTLDQVVRYLETLRAEVQEGTQSVGRGVK